MLKRFLSIFLCALLLLCLACRNTDAGDQLPAVVFSTKNIVRITLYTQYGHSDGCDVPAENMEEYTQWLESFAFAGKASDMLPPGTDTVHVEIEYSDGTIVKNGIDTMVVDSVTYELTHAAMPESYQDIISALFKD